MPLTDLVGAIASTEHADAVLEVAYLMTAVDGRLEPQEMAAFRALVSRVRGAEVSDHDLERLTGRFILGVQRVEIVDRVRTVGATIPEPLREAAFTVALALTMIDKDDTAHESELVGTLAEVLGVSARREALTEQARVALR